MEAEFDDDIAGARWSHKFPGTSQGSAEFPLVSAAFAAARAAAAAAPAY